MHVSVGFEICFWAFIWDTSDWSFGSILSEEFLISKGGIVKLVVIVLGTIKELSVRRMHPVIIFWEFNIEVWNPSKLSIDIPLSCHFGVIWHAGTFDLVFLVWVQLSLWIEQYLLCIFSVFIKVLLVMPRVGFIESWGRYMMSKVPIVVSETGIISVVLDHLFLGQKSTTIISLLTPGHFNQLICIFTSQWCFAVQGSYRWSHLSKDHHVILRHIQTI